MKTAIQELIQEVEELKKTLLYPSSFKAIDSCIDLCYSKLELEKQQNKQVICKHCEKPISVNDINNHLFMNVKGGGLIHWNCTDK